MNKTITMGNLTDEPKIRQTSTGKKVAEFSLAVNRMKEGADFPHFVAWEHQAEFVEKYCHKGMRFLIEGHIQTGSYEKDGHKVYTTDIIVEKIEFCEKKSERDGSEGQPKTNPTDEFMKIPEGIEEEMPFN